MKHNYSLWRRVWLCVALLTFLARAHGQAPAWRNVAVVNGGSQTRSMAVTSTGDVIVVGYFYGTVSFGATTLTSAGSSDIFVAKWRPSTNQFVWVQQGGGQLNDDVAAVAVWGNSIYVGGSFSSAVATFGSVQLRATSMEGYVVKLTDNGTSGAFVWGERLGGNDMDNVSALAANATGVYAGGMFIGTATMGSFTLSSAGLRDGFVARLTDAGSTATVSWVQAVAGSQADEVWGLALNGSSVYVAGPFNSSARFGSLTLSGAGNFDGFVAKLTDSGTAGTFNWAQRVGGYGDDYVSRIVAAGSDLYVVGAFAQYYNSSTAELGPFTLTSAGNGDGFVAKLTDAGTAGTFRWAQRLGGADADYAGAVAVRGSEVLVAGTFNSPTASFGSLSLTRTGTQRDLFLLRLTDAGTTTTVRWAQQVAGGGFYDVVQELGTTSNSVFMAGAVQLPTSFGALSVTGYTASPAAFVAELADQTLAAKSARTTALALFPNPAHDAVRVRVPAGAADVTVLDLLGRPVRTVPTRPGQAETVVSLRGLAAGSYLLRSGLATGKLVVE